MAILKAIGGAAKSHAGLRNTLEYVLRDSKAQEGYKDTQGPMPAKIDYDTVYRAFLEEKKVHEKDSGRMCAHYVLSFHKNEAVTPEQVLDFGREFAEKAFDGYQAVIAVHQDKAHLHCHLVVNSVSYEADRNKLHTKRQDLERMKKLTNKLCLERGLSVAEKGKHFDGTAIEEGSTTIAWQKNKYQMLEHDGEEKTSSGKTSNRQRSYVVACALAASDAKESAVSKEEFIQKMEECGWKTTWSDTRKNITFENAEGKKVRNSNLTKTFNIDFSKEALLREFERQKEERAKQAAELDNYYRQLERVDAGLEKAAGRSISDDSQPGETIEREGRADTASVVRSAINEVRNSQAERRVVEVAESESRAAAEQRRFAEQQRAENKKRNRRHRRSYEYDLSR